MCDARRHTGPAFNRPITEGSPVGASSASDRRGQAGTGGASTPLAPSVSHPVQSTTTGREATTSPAPERNPTRAIARAILSTLTPTGAAFVLATVAALARAIIDAAAMLRQSTQEEEARAVLGEALEGFDAPHPSGDTLARGYALTALWWFATPRDVCGELTGAFWRNDGARESCEGSAREALEDIEALATEAREASTARAARVRRELVEDVATMVSPEGGAAARAVKASVADMAGRDAGSVEALALARALGELASERGARGMEGAEPFAASLEGARVALALALRASELGVAMEEDTARRAP